MPRKLRQLIADLKHSGFHFVPGKGSHRKYCHLSGAMVVLSGQAGDDAKPYQEKEVSLRIAEVQQYEKN